MRIRSQFSARKIAPYLFCLPFYVAFIVVYLIPFSQTILMSLQNVKLIGGGSKFIGLNNYRQLFNPHFYAAVGNSFLYMILYLIVEIPLSLGLALALNSKICRFRNFFKAALFVPILASTVITGVLFRLMFANSDDALINSILIGVGAIDKGIPWLYSTRLLGIVVLVFVSVWRNTGINIVFCLSGLQGVSPELYDAAKVDGASGFGLFRYVTLPGIKPTLLYILTTSIMGGLSMFSESYVLWKDATVGDVGNTIVRYLYETGFYKGSFGMASAIGIVLLILVMCVNLFQLRVFGFFEED